MTDLIKKVAEETTELVRWASSVQLEDIPEVVLRRGVLVVGDDIGAMVASRNEPEVICVQEQFLRNQGTAEATVYRGGQNKTDRYSAAAANALAANWCELDEGYRKVACHAGLYALPALLSEAESDEIPFGELLKSLVVSYEVITRLARVWHFSSARLHPHAIFAAVGAAAAVACLRRLDTEVFFNALMSAASLITVGPYDHAVKGALIENMWAASGAWNGMRSVDWAQCGIAGLRSSFYDVYTIALGGEVRLKEFTAGLGDKWAINDGYNKLYACCQYAHSAAEAALAVFAELPATRKTKNIKQIIVETHKLGLELKNYNPETTLAARFSLPHIIAASLYFGHAGAEAFGSETLSTEEIAQLRKRVKLKKFQPEQKWPHDRPARVTVDFEDGRSLSHECLSATGSPDRPLTEKQILEKMSQLTNDVYPNMAAMISKFFTLGETYLKAPWDKLVDLMVAQKS